MRLCDVCGKTIKESFIKTLKNKLLRKTSESRCQECVRKKRALREGYWAIVRVGSLTTLSPDTLDFVYEMENSFDSRASITGRLRNVIYFYQLECERMAELKLVGVMTDAQLQRELERQIKVIHKMVLEAESDIDTY